MLSMFQKLNKKERMLLLKFVCAFAWADLEVKDSEVKFVKRLMDRLELDEAERAQVDEWLVTAPAPDSVSPGRIPQEHKRVFIESARALMYVDGDIDDDERAQLDRLKEALA